MPFTSSVLNVNNKIMLKFETDIMFSVGPTSTSFDLLFLSQLARPRAGRVSEQTKSPLGIFLAAFGIYSPLNRRRMFDHSTWSMIKLHVPRRDPPHSIFLTFALDSTKCIWRFLLHTLLVPFSWISIYNFIWSEKYVF